MTSAPGTQRRADPRPDLVAPALGLCAALLYLLTSPAVVNSDGLGYLKLLPHNFAAGHLLYMPLLRTATRMLGDSGLLTGRLLNALLGGTGVLLAHGIAHLAAPLRADRRFVAALTASGLAVSYGYWAQGGDVEAYALAMVALLALVRVALPYRTRPSLPRAAAMGLLLGLAVLTHLTHVLASLFVVAVCLEDPRGRRAGAGAAALALALGGALSLGAYAYAAFIVRGHHLEGAIRWVATASHGFSERGSPYAIAGAVYGLCRSLVWAPYLHEADAPRLLGQFLLGLVLLVGLVALVRARTSALSGLPLRPLFWLVVPYAAIALLFFGADPERWIFVLPALWLIAATAIDALAARRFWGPLVVAYLALLNLFLAALPAHFDTGPRRMAELAATQLSNGDLLIFPGHGWDEYVAFYGKKRIEPFPVVYYAARDGAGAMWSRLDREVAAAHARGHAVFAVRFFDEDKEVDDDPAGYVELRALGLSRAKLRGSLEERFHPTTVLERDGVVVVRLESGPSTVILKDAMTAAPAPSTSGPTVDYTIDLADRNAHLYRVELTVSLASDAPDEVTFQLPVWTPGSYLIREFARHLQELSCADETGRVLAIDKRDKATWFVRRGTARTLTVRYRVFAHDLTPRAAHLDDTHGFWNGASLCLYHAPQMKLPHRVRVIAPDGWRVTVGLPEVAPSTFAAVDYDELIDSPFEVGTHELIEFDALGKPHRIAIWGHLPVARDKLTTDFGKIVAVAADLFDGGVPYEGYTFIILSTPGGYGGLEHCRSTTLLTSPYNMQPRKKYEEFLELVSHEFFHLWNVKRIHPAVLGPFDYQREAYTRSIWVMEGVTSYYDRLLLVRAGLKKPKAYLEVLAEELGKIAEIPGRLRHSLEEASFDAWIKFYRPDENSSNSSISYYLKGGVVALLLDLTIRARSEGARSLDDVMRLLWRRYGARGVGFADEDVQAIFEEAAGLSLADFFSRFVRGRDELELAPLLRSIGLMVAVSKPEDAGPWLGVTTRESGDNAVVATTLAGGPGEAAGLFAGDELLAIDGFRVESSTLKARLKDRRVGDQVTLTVFRRDQLRAVPLTLGERPASEHKITVAPDATAAEGAAFERWMGAPLDCLREASDT